VSAVFFDVDGFSPFFIPANKVGVLPGIRGNIVPREDSIISGREPVNMHTAEIVGTYSAIQVEPLPPWRIRDEDDGCVWKRFLLLVQDYAVESTGIRTDENFQRALRRAVNAKRRIQCVYRAETGRFYVTLQSTESNSQLIITGRNVRQRERAVGSDERHRDQQLRREWLSPQFNMNAADVNVTG